MASTLISVVNESARVSDAEAAVMVLAVGKQLARDVAPIWGLMPALEFVPKGGTIAAGSMLCTLSDTPDIPGAAGYHYLQSNGIPAIKVFTFDGGSALKGANAVSVTLSHEVIELTLNPDANLWADGRDGADYAREGCDSPEAQTYEVDGVAVSNFVYPEFFNPSAPSGSKLDYLEMLTAPFETAPDGYQLRRTEPGRVTQVFASHIASDHDVRDLYQDGPTVFFLVFGKNYPEEKKPGKINKALFRFKKVD